MPTRETPTASHEHMPSHMPAEPPATAAQLAPVFALVGLISLAAVLLRRKSIRQHGIFIDAVSSPVSAPPSPPEPDEAGGPSAVDGPMSVTTVSSMTRSDSMKSRIKAYDRNGDGQFDSGEVVDMVVDIDRAEKEKRDLKEQRDRLRRWLLCAAGVIVLLTLSMFAVSWAASELVKETHADKAVLTDRDGSVLNVGAATATIPLYALAAMEMEALWRVNKLSVSYMDGGERVRRNLRIVSQVKRGSTVELLDALGFKVELEGTSDARLLTPDGAEYTLCAADATCSSVTVDNTDLQAFEEEAVDMAIDEEDAAEAIANSTGEGDGSTAFNGTADSRRRRLDTHERRRLARRSLSSSCPTTRSYPDALFSDWTTKRECYPAWNNAAATASKGDQTKAQCLAKCQAWDTGAGGCCWYRSNKDKCRWYDASDGNIQYAYRNDGDSKTIMLEGTSTATGSFSWGPEVEFDADANMAQGVRVLSGVVAAKHGSLASFSECKEACLGDNLFVAEWFGLQKLCRCYGSADEVTFEGYDSVLGGIGSMFETSMRWRRFGFYSDVPGRTTWTYTNGAHCISADRNTGEGLLPQGWLTTALDGCKELCIHAGHKYLEFWEWTDQYGRLKPQCQCCDSSASDYLAAGGVYTAVTAEAN